MALSFAKIWKTRSSDIVDSFFDRARDAELHRHEEHAAAATIQKVWRGFVVRRRVELYRICAQTIQRYYRGWLGRKFLEQLVVARNRRRRMTHYYAMAVRIQKTWRGYHSRKYKFDYFKRKQYIEGVKRKIDEVREQLAAHAIEQRKITSEYETSIASATLDRLASTRHHLLGTKSVPGVYSRRLRSQSASPSRKHSRKSHQLAAPAHPENRKSTSTRGSPQPSHSHTHTHRNHESVTKTSHHPPNLLPPIRIPEEKLRDNAVLRAWISQHIGPRNYPGKPLRPTRPSDELGPEAMEKPEQGPFLPKGRLLRVLRKPLRPTLRVETGFGDTLEAQREDRRKRDALRVSDKLFTVVPRVDHSHPDYFLGGDPYDEVYFRYRQSMEEIRGAFKGKKDFCNIVHPVPLFDDLADEY
ncbi:hypothetical protein DFS34DRAFT_619671 [Phlyctochytrium arcticum]|nr:hypothetical protein DFS34DRAFT_619671 [Phlyctochytrium arcticum]